jgi:hypothetical protein
MKYIEDLELDGEYIEGIVQLKNIDKPIKICSYSEVGRPYIEKCLNHFENLSDERWKEMKYYIEKYAKDMEYDIKGNDVLKNIKFQNIQIKYPNVLSSNNDLIPTYSIECSCKWEIEHGMEIVITGDKIMYVGTFDDVGLWHTEDYYKDIFGNYVYCDIE